MVPRRRRRRSRSRRRTWARGSPTFRPGVDFVEFISTVICGSNLKRTNIS
jgi:hypothetical protein